MTYCVLVVEDEPGQRRLLEHIVTAKLGLRCLTAEGGREAVDKVLGGAKPRPDIILLDWNMPEVGGMEVLKAVRPQRPDLPVVVLTAHGDIETAVTAMRAGASDFLAKPVEVERLKVSLHNALQRNFLAGEVSRLQRKVEGQFCFSDLIGDSQALHEVAELGQRVANSTIPVLLQGESGVGKELFARAIHGSGERAGKPFVAVNCGAMPPDLVESILFGHEKGAFTGATYRTLGKFREADGGTLLLDEVGELRPEFQVKLLRVLQNAEVEPVGGSRPVPVDVRIISASNADLEQLLGEGVFREDLFYRLNVFPIRLPSLAERKEDIPALVEHFCSRFAAQENKVVRGVTPRALEALCNHDWPGNVRQLENAVFRAVVLAESEMLDVQDFAGILGATVVRLPGYNSQLPGNFLLNDKGQVRPLEEIESTIIRFALEHTEGHMSEAARQLGIGRSTLYRKVEQLGLQQKSA